MKKIRKIQDLYINGKNYPLLRIEGKEHSGLNGEPKNWWVYYDQAEIPLDMIPLDSPSLEPFCSSINRSVYEIKIKQNNSVKFKWKENDFRNHCSVLILCNGKPYYSFGTTGNSSGLSFALGKIEYLLTSLAEHPFNFFDPQSEHGRKIFWKGMPAFVNIWREDTPWEIGIEPDYSEIPRDKWWKMLEIKERKETHIPDENDLCFAGDREGDMSSNFINWGDAYSDDHIYWFRK